MSSEVFAGAKETPPQGPPPKPFHLPATTDFTLPNGMQVTIVPYGTVPKVAVRLLVGAGAIDESAGQVWLSKLNAALMKEGTRTRSAEQVAREAAEMGGQVEIDAAPDFTSVGGVVLSDFGPKFVALLADVLIAPSLPASELPRLKADLVRGLSINKTAPPEGRFGPGAFDRQIAARGACPGALRPNPVSRSSLRPRVSVRERAKRLRHSGRADVLPEKLPRGARASLYCRQARRRSAPHDRRRVRRLGQRSAGARSAGSPGEGALVPSHRQARRRPVEPFDRPAGCRAVQSGFHQTGRHEFPVGRLVRLPHYQQYSRREGLHIFAVEPDRHPPASRLLAAIRRCGH